MRLLPIVVFAGLPLVALAQDAAVTIEKADGLAADATVTPEALGLPAAADAPKVVDLTASKAAEAQPSDFGFDKLAGNEGEAFPDFSGGPLTLRTKAPSFLPEPAPAAVDLGTGPQGEKVAVLEAGKAIEGRTTTYDTDKIDGNEPTSLPLAERQKSPSYGLSDTGDLDQGVPPAPVDPKTADIAVSHADGVLSGYDDDKIEGNAPFDDEFATGPLSERQKYPSELTEGADPASFGQPASDAPKEADLAVSKAEISVPNIEDNDKIAGNPYITPPLLPRAKLPSVLPDPVADANLGQPVAEVAKVDLAVSKDADGRPTIEDNDKIDGNPVVNPPLVERSKGAAYEPAMAGLSDDELGLPLTPDEIKTADVGVSKLAEAVSTEYDEDKIAGNGYQDPFANPEMYDLFDPEPPAELVDQVRALIDDPATRTATLDGIKARGLAPEPVAPAFQSFLGILYDNPKVRERMALEIAGVFLDVGLTPENPAAVGRMAAEYLAGFGENEAWLGTALRSMDEQRTYLTNLLRVAETLTPEQCAPYLDGTMDPAQQRRLLLQAIADWTEDDRNTVFIHRAAAILAHLDADGFAEGMSDPDAQAARASLGAAALAAIDAQENGAELLAAFGDPSSATPEQTCAVQKLILGAALAKTGPDGDLAVRYLVENGWAS